MNDSIRRIAQVWFELLETKELIGLIGFPIQQILIAERVVRFVHLVGHINGLSSTYGLRTRAMIAYMTTIWGELDKQKGTLAFARFPRSPAGMFGAAASRASTSRNIARRRR
jgi:hypothetical protein